MIPDDASIRDQWLHGAPLASPALARAAHELADRLEEVLHDTVPPLLTPSP